MIALLVAQAALTSSPPPPVFVISRPSDEARAEMSVDIVLRGNGTVLWQGSLRVSGSNESSWRQIVTEPPLAGCPSTRDWNARANETTVQLMPTFRAANVPAEVAVTARWQRAGDDRCGGTRTVELRQTVILDRREPIVLRGDGGLVVEIRRR